MSETVTILSLNREREREYMNAEQVDTNTEREVEWSEERMAHDKSGKK